MNAKPTLARPHIATTLAAAALSALIAVGLLAGVTGLLQRDGVPFEQAVIAERACADFAFESERKACVHMHFAASRLQNVASR